MNTLLYKIRGPNVFRIRSLGFSDYFRTAARLGVLAVSRAEGDDDVLPSDAVVHGVVFRNSVRDVGLVELEADAGDGSARVIPVAGGAGLDGDVVG